MSHTDRILPRISLIAGVLGAVVLLAGCGGSSPAAGRAGAVRLAVAGPGDMSSVRDGSVEIRGTVRPANATVTVRGRKASLSGGSWTASVDLEPGVNVVDVLASAGSAKPALTAVRVRRIVDVEVPDVTGLSADDAKQQLQDAHLAVKTETDNGGFFDQILGGDPQVCSTNPEPGTTVDPGTTVTVQLSRRC